MKNILSTFLLIFAAHSAFACVCKDIGKLSKINVASYDIIFMGKVLAVSGDDREQHVQFSIQELFKGSTYQGIEFVHNPSSDCSLSFLPGEVWTIYGRWMEYDVTKRQGIATTDFCTFSRVQPPNDTMDAKLPGRGSFTEELKFLRDSLGVQEFMDPSEHKDQLHKNELPGAGMALGYLAAGLGGLAIIFYFVRRMFKRDGK